MGKIRRQRRKLHLEAKSKADDQTVNLAKVSTKSSELIIKPQDNLFEGLQIDINALNKNLSDGASVKSFKSVKSESGAVSKKDKLKMRREMLMKKFEVLNQQKLLEKRKKKAVVGDLNPLRDALPSLESLLKSRGSVNYKQAQPKKKKGIEKTGKLKKSQLQGIKIFQQVFKNKQFRKDPQQVISQHLKAVLDNEK